MWYYIKNNILAPIQVAYILKIIEKSLYLE